MAEHLPWINHLAAREAGCTLTEFAALPPAEQAEWRRFTLEGPSRLRDTLMIAEIRNLFVDFLTGEKTLTPVNEKWMDGILEHPDAAFQRRLDEAKARRREAAIQRARALHEREQAAGK